MKRARGKQRGFSLIEMLVVVAILMIVAGIAVPKTMEAIYDMRLRSAATEVAGLMQQARIMAIKNNSYYPVKAAVVSGATFFYIDTSALPPASPNRNTNTAYDSSFPTNQLGSGISMTSTNPDTSGTSTPWAFTPLTSTSYFWGPMGLPCALPSTSSLLCQTSITGASGTQPAGYLVILTDNRTFGARGYLAVTASPAGRVHVWQWTGSAWQ